MKARFGYVLGFVVLAAAFARWQPDTTFPHAKHAKLFPTCAGCHEGVINEQATDRFPSPEACASCHDGTQLRAVSWSGHKERATNLHFSHVDHARESQEKQGSAVECQACHRDPAEDSTRMAVAGALPTNCIGCHAHRAPEHLADNAVCSTCHVPLARATAVSDSDVMAFAKPASHTAKDFVSAHRPATVAAAAQCATCHTRESCARCHPNTSRVSAIAGLGSDPRIAKLVADKRPSYPRPAWHRRDGFAIDHGNDARVRVAECADCHTQQSCQTCHTGKTASTIIAQLGDGTDGARGVQIRRVTANITPASHRDDGWRAQHGAAATSGVSNCSVCHTQQSCQSCHAGPSAPKVIAELPDAKAVEGSGTLMRNVSDKLKTARAHPANFVSSHGATAAAGGLACQSCHEQRFCTDCHDGTGRNRFHKANYVASHAADAYSRDRNCSTCHTTETFCRSCHISNGLASRGAVQGNAHNGQPMWLLQHGQAARQGLEGCTSCHQQRDCLRCHSAVGLHMNPHGSGFDAAKAYAKNRQTCMVCHLTDPMAR